MGRGIAHELGAQGATVIITARTMTADQATRLAPDQPPIPGTLEATVKLVRATGAEVFALPAGFGDEEQVRMLIAQVPNATAASTSWSIMLWD